MLKFNFVVVAALWAAFTTSALAYDLTNPKDRLEAYVKSVGDLNGEEAVNYGKVTVFAKVPGQKGVPLFYLEVVGVSRFIPVEGGYRRLHREIGFYTDLETEDIMTTWDNPLNGRTVDVLAIQNDPVNFTMVVSDNEIENRTHALYGDQVIFYSEVMLRYPSPIKRADYPLNSQDDWYEAGELFNTFVSLEDLNDPETTSAPSQGSWSRFGPWLPWMEMADTPGMLVYHGHSVKFMNGVAEIPERLLTTMEKDYAKYLSAPDTDESPNETSWSYFKKVLDAKSEE